MTNRARDFSRLLHRAEFAGIKAIRCDDEIGRERARRYLLDALEALGVPRDTRGE